MSKTEWLTHGLLNSANWLGGRSVLCEHNLLLRIAEEVILGVPGAKKC